MGKYQWFFYIFVFIEFIVFLGYKDYIKDFFFFDVEYGQRNMKFLIYGIGRVYIDFKNEVIVLV